MNILRMISEYKVQSYRAHPVWGFLIVPYKISSAKEFVIFTAVPHEEVSNALKA